ncbi:DUF2730 family protein [Roseovarius ramblicola]|uniref:DUF2730 family protein n=1 Tax=Roseovarius ramblicola TaxID=2022336 RepID=A0ABV5HWD8_9RHOB
MMDWDLFWKASGVILPLLVAIYTFLATRRTDVDKQFEAGDERMDRHEGRIAWLEQTVQVMPGKDDTHRLELMLSEMSGDMKAMCSTMEGMKASLQRTEDIVGRHEDHLREKH